jgi:hypothetical protein
MLGVLFIAGGFFAGAAVAQPAINVGTGSGSPGGTATFSVTLTANGAQVAATENDIGFDPNTPIAVRTSAGGNCTVTTTTACTSDTDCPILAPPFDHEACVGSPAHCAVTTTTSCTTDADCPTVHEPCVNQSGPDCSVNPTLAPVCSNNNSQTCTQDSDCGTGNTCVHKSGFFTFLPHVCSNAASTVCSADSDCTGGGLCTGACSGTQCTGVRAVIVAVDNLGAIPDGSTLYSCNVSIASTATPQSYTLTISNESAGDVNQALISNVSGTNGSITVSSAQSVFVCNVEPHTGDNVGEFGNPNNTLSISDTKSIFKAAQFGGSFLPAAGSARLIAMDAAPVDNPPTCGGSAPPVINIADVKQCFKRAQFSGQTNYTRTLSGSSCTSAVAP